MPAVTAKATLFLLSCLCRLVLGYPGALCIRLCIPVSHCQTVCQKLHWGNDVKQGESMTGTAGRGGRRIPASLEDPVPWGTCHRVRLEDGSFLFSLRSLL